MAARQTSGLGHADAGEDPWPTRFSHQLGQGIQGASTRRPVIKCQGGDHVEDREKNGKTNGKTMDN